MLTVEASHYVCRPVSSLPKIAIAPLPCPFSGTFGILLDRMLEPGGNRVEVMGDPGYMIFDPAWKTVVWKASELDVGAAWTGTPMPDSFWNYGTPVATE